ncbi:hypothetical protein V8D89_008015 [Ganoderma adspersum]
MPEDEYFEAFDNDFGDFDSDYDYLDAPFGQDCPPPPLADPLPHAAAQSDLYENYTNSLREGINIGGPPILERILSCINHMNSVGLNLELFLDAIFWGDSGCISNSKIRHERTVFMNSATLPTVLSHWWRPPNHHHVSGGQERVQEFIIERAGDVLEIEVKAATGYFQLPPDSDPLSYDNLTRINF